jgi:photosystem II stability/assembly factor-like uncharacterized protein
MIKKGALLILFLGFYALVSAQGTANPDWFSYEGPWCAKRLVDVAVGSVNESPVIYGVNYDYSLVKSTDEGQSWSVIMKDVDIRCVTCDPDNGNLVYIGLQSSDGGIMLSIDAGTNWNQINTGLPASFTPGAIAMRDAQHIVLGLEPQSADEYSIYYWNINNNQWTYAIMSGSQTGFFVTDLKWDPRSGYEEFIYASSDKVVSGGNSDYIGVYRSTNNGVNWSQIGQPVSGQPGYMMRPEAISVCCALNSYIFAGYRPEVGSHSDGGVMRTTDGGATWGRVLHQDWLPVNDVLGDAVNSDKVYAVFGSGSYSYTGLGVYRNTNSGDAAYWHPFNEDLTDFYTNVLTTFEHDSQHYLYLGTDNSFYVRNLTTPTNWVERVNEMHKAKVIAVEPRIPGFFAFSDRANYASLDDGDNWSTRSTVARISENLSAGVHPSLNNEMLKWTKVLLPEIEYGLYHSDNGGFTWNSVYCELNDVIPPIPNIDYSYYSPERVYTFTNHSENYERFLLRSDDTGNSWSEYSTDLVSAKISAVACDRTIGGIDHIFICGIPLPGLIHESTDGGTTWESKTPVLLFGWGTILFDPKSSNVLLAELAGSEVSQPLWLKTTNSGDNWKVVSNLLGYYPGPFTIDPEEPTLVYAAPLNPNTNCNDAYFSVDYCHKWIENNKGLPDARVWDLGIDPNSPQCIYAGTDSGIYYYDPSFNKHLVSSSDSATCYNNGRHLVRDEQTDDVLVTYESGGVVYLVGSDDDGNTWSRKLSPGEGAYPVIAKDLYPYVVYVKHNDIDTLYFAKYTGALGSGDWNNYVLYTSSNTIGPSSFVIDASGNGHACFNISVQDEDDIVKYLKFSLTSGSVTYSFDVANTSEYGSASIDLMVFGSLHIAYDANGVIWYRERNPFGGWQRPERVSSIFMTDCHHPSLEVAGTNIYVVWESKSGDYRDIFHRYKYNGQWYNTSIVSDGSFESSYPVLSKGWNVTWQEDVSDNQEVYKAQYDPLSGGWDRENISNTEMSSCYPHFNIKEMENSTAYYYVWTENNNAPYDVEYKYLVSGGPSPLYIADAGYQEPSPFTQRRGNYHSYGSKPFQKIDIDADSLIYRFDGLNPKKVYKGCAVFYEEGMGKMYERISVDGVSLGDTFINPNNLVIYNKVISPSFYADSTLTFSIKGVNNNNAVMSLLLLYEYERGGGGGSQFSGNVSNRFTEGIRIFPNPVTTSAEVSYNLNREKEVSLLLFDCSGRRIKSLINGKVTRGNYSVSLDCRALPTGVYFLRLNVGGKTFTRKMTVVK